MSPRGERQASNRIENAPIGAKWKTDGGTRALSHLANIIFILKGEAVTCNRIVDGLIAGS